MALPFDTVLFHASKEHVVYYSALNQVLVYFTQAYALKVSYVDYSSLYKHLHMKTVLVNLLLFMTQY
jgi:hypothetical protein